MTPRGFGLLLITIGFFGAAFFSVRQADSAGLEWQSIEWGPYIAFFLAGAVGVVLVRWSTRTADTHSHRLDADLNAMRSSLSTLVEKLSNLNSNKDQTAVYDIHGRIDGELVKDLNTFVEARESLIHLYDMQRYADLMGLFALGERQINRAWSASADGYVDEVWICLAAAQSQMEQARSKLDTYQRENPALSGSV